MTSTTYRYPSNSNGQFVNVNFARLPKRSLALLRELRGEEQRTGFVFTTRDKGNVLRRFYKTLKRRAAGGSVP